MKMQAIQLRIYRLWIASLKKSKEPINDNLKPTFPKIICFFII